ncbi:MAG: hypothetical protein OHK0013_06930 [Sandaracinaceae bacterium]
MSFGRNPYVAKAETAEQKALDATDDATRVRAHRDAAREWERAAAREKPGKRRDAYLANAERNRAIADGEAVPEEGPSHVEPADDSRLN